VYFANGQTDKILVPFKVYLYRVACGQVVSGVEVIDTKEEKEKGKKPTEKVSCMTVLWRETIILVSR
jgi:hypothetical protein